jgi:hypothetical protein
MPLRGIGVAIAATLILGTLVGSAAAQPQRATLMPRSLDPLVLKGDGFKRHERVRVTVTPTSGEGTTKRVRAKRRGSFSVAFTGVQTCDGFEGVAVGRRGSRASFQFSAIGCPAR